MVRLAAIGVGGRLSSMIGGMCRLSPDVRLVAAVDPAADAARERLTQRQIDCEKLRFHPSVESMLEYSDQFDGLLIGTRCFMHAPMAVKVAGAKLPLFLEKPVAITDDQLSDLRNAWRGQEERVVVSFPLRVTSLVVKAKELIDAGRLGTINQIQAFNNVTYGKGYYAGWYRNFDQVGGLWLQKATHDFDYLNYLVGAPPTMLAAMMTRKVYGGDKPHELRCSACDIASTCPEAPQPPHPSENDGSSAAPPAKREPMCVYSSEIRNQDAGSALIRYADNTIVSYDQNFISRKQAGRRGAIITGHKGTIEFDWYTKKLRFVDHFSEKVEEFDGSGAGGHGGGDEQLQRSFIDLVRGEGKSVADLRDGLLSVAMCLAARRSCHTNQFVPIPAFDGSTPQQAPAIAKLEC